MTESIRDGVTGLLVDTPEELTRAAGTLLDDPASRARLSGACRDWALAFDWERAADDVAVVHDGATVLIDQVSIGYLKGSEIDFVDDLIGASFRVINPQATASCGCGTSFSI